MSDEYPAGEPRHPREAPDERRFQLQRHTEASKELTSWTHDHLSAVDLLQRSFPDIR